MDADRMNDGIVECVGAADERMNHCSVEYPLEITRRFRRWNSSKCIGLEDVCDGIKDCPLNDDEHLSLTAYTSVKQLTSSVPAPVAVPLNAKDSHSCNKGIVIMSDGMRECLCSPSFYGTFCEYQNANYSVRVIAFSCTTEHINLMSLWYFPIRFPFLPVNRLSVKINVAESSTSVPCSIDCLHGVCMSYINLVNGQYCLCDDGWLGQHYDTSSIFEYSNKPKLIDSKCICPLGRYGIDCNALFDPCRAIVCRHGGTCFPLDPRTSQKYICIYTRDCLGDVCQYSATRSIIHMTDILIDPSVSRIPLVVVHLVDLRANTAGNCTDKGYCQNGGHCVEPVQKQPIVDFACVCRPCFYGQLCQFTTTKYSISLEALIGSDIYPDKSLSEQSIIIKMVLAVVILMITIGLVCNTLSIITFAQPKTQELGCDFYMMRLSIISQVGLIAFGARYIYSLISQTSVIQNVKLTLGTCIALEFLISSLSSTFDWLTACIAIERALTAVKEINFDKALRSIEQKSSKIRDGRSSLVECPQRYP
ncbi:unnamed protein product [Didymodactylos carnosus]|uniref:EGF-like domain-containing protein n=1 Tax=Didymodactylos carnosus TaxID=1234261 RepID=A0A815H914_9BILA|nr:unnamed protein product [Didymodactylos carnosus]CAF1352564.1 unnamed protein product [Didymodactylos carnosus]CAF4162901.1 unnamed protein product [Didymodactylos carnosus]CAF4216282.1 unnamed protein product [Didymodactylos carnosus]